MDDIAVDIGGTQLRAALYPPEGLDARVSRSIPTAGENAAIERLFDLITSVWPADGAVGCGGVEPANRSGVPGTEHSQLERAEHNRTN